MIRATSKLIVRITLGVTLLLLTASLSLYIWIITGPRSITFLNPYIEESLNTLAPAHIIKINNTLLIWDEEQKTVDLRASGIKIYTKDNVPVAALPEISVSIAVTQLIQGHIELTNLSILNSAFKLSLDKTSTAPESSSKLYPEFIKELFALADSSLSHKGLNNIHVRNADVLITNEASVLFKIPNARATFLRNNEKLIITIEIQATLEGKDIQFNILLEPEDATTYKAHIDFKDIPIDSLYALLPKHTYLQGAKLLASGKITAHLPKDAPPSLHEIIISHLSGNFTHPHHFTYPITISDMKARGHFIHDTGKLAIDEAKVTLDDSTLEMKGFIKHKDLALEELLIEATARNVPISEVFRYWPEKLSPIPRKWVTQRITGGSVPEASVKLWLTAEDLKNKKIPASSLEATVAFNDAAVDYFSEYPPALHVDGVAKFTGNSIDISITDGTVLDSRITEATVSMPKIRQKKIVKIKGTATGKLSNATAFFNTAPINKTLQTPLESLEGQAKTDISLIIPLIKKPKLEDMDITILSQIKSATIPNLFKKYDLTSGIFLFGFDGNMLTLSGKTAFNTVPVILNLQQQITPDANGILGLYSLKTSLTPAHRRLLGFPEIPSLQGKMATSLTITQKADKRDISVSADLTESTLTLTNFGWEKPKGQPASFELHAVDALKNTINIPKFTLSSNAISASGRAVVTKDFSNFHNIDLKNIRAGKSDFSLLYNASETAQIIHIAGNALDLSKADPKMLLSKKDKRMQKSFNAMVNLNNIYLKNNEKLSFLKAELHCSARYCHTGNMNAHIPDSDERLDIALTPVNATKSHYLLQGGDAGRVLRALNIYNTMNGGWLNIDGHIENRRHETTKNPYNFMSGLLKIHNFTLTKTPTLAKIATLASFEGISDILNNKGTSFKRLRAPYNIQDNIITVKEVKAAGSSLGFTADGYINLNDATLSMAGTFVPSYTINNFLSKIPLVGPIGDVLMGGKGQGILAARYKLKGKIDNAEVTVNPLSILTPGFLRNLFDIIDAGPAIPTLKPRSALVWEDIRDDDEDNGYVATIH